jgi:hypothetical protein
MADPVSPKPVGGTGFVQADHKLGLCARPVHRLCWPGLSWGEDLLTWGQNPVI